ncbi:MAG: SdrD B-like domain-containing protein, partial [Actinomycetota bacterium]
TVTLLSGDVDRTLDIGLVAPATIGDRVWHDLDGDGVQDAGELGLGGVVVEVRDGPTLVGSATTDGAGVWSVVVAPGTYDVALDATSIPSGPNSGAVMTPTVAPSTPITVISAELVDSADFGLVTTARIGDTIFEDIDGDGVQDPGEPGLAGVDVQLVDRLGTVVATVTTAADGSYELTGVEPGTWSVSVDAATLPPGAVATTSPGPVTVTVESDEIVDQVDLGFALPASLAGVIWVDEDGDGTRNGEPPLGGVSVELLDATGTVVATETSGADGAFVFDGLRPGDHRVRPVLPAGMNLTTPDVGTDDTVDSDVLTGSGSSAPITIVSSAAVTDVDAGLFELGRIGDTVFADLDGDGVQDLDEPGVAGVTVTVRDVDGAVVGTAMSDVDGRWSIDVVPGSYLATVTAPQGWTTVGGRDVRAATVTSGGSDLGADFPLEGARSLAGNVVYDVAGDATNDVTDPGLAGITITSIWSGPDGPVQFTTTTDPDGSYRFDGLPPGDHLVAVDQKDLPDGIVDPTIDPDAGVDLETDVSLGVGSVAGLDFGVTGTARLGDNVFVDVDGDGERDPGEQGVGGVTLTAQVTTTSGVMTFTTVTDADGFYEFTDLPAGDYVVSLEAGTIPVGLGPSIGDRSTTLVIGAADDTLDMPLVPVAGPQADDDTAATPPATPVVIEILSNDTVQSGTTVVVSSTTSPS